MMNSILLTNVMSTHRISSQHFSRMSHGTGSILSNTCLGIVLAVLPFCAQRLAPKILSAEIASNFDIGDILDDGLQHQQAAEIRLSSLCSESSLL
mmetsp:Transcript_14385/g.18812  ORF Transcript_14385/g.18812 Transcript_14385/m.18812 type:complete len:95 (+) Transcript_14385:186-470(+)